MISIPIGLMSLFFVVVGFLWILALSFPQLGVRWYGRVWPANFTDLSKRRAAYMFGIAQGIGYMFAGISGFLFALLRALDTPKVIMWGVPCLIIGLSFASLIFAFNKGAFCR